MKTIKKLIWLTMACLIMMPFSKVTAYASQGTISLSDPTAKVGESVSVTVKVTATGSETLKSVDMSITYDNSVLEFESGTSATGESGTVKLTSDADSAIKTYTLNFKALKESTSNIKIANYEIKDSKDSVVEMSKVGSSTVTISGGDSSVETTTGETSTEDMQGSTEPTEETKIVTPPGKDVEVEIAGTPFYVCKIPKEEIPEGFEYIGYEFQGKAVDAVKSDSVILFYLNQIGEEPIAFYVYDKATEGFSIYAPVNPCLNYTVVNLDEDVTIPEGFIETEVSVGGVAVTAWQSSANAEYYLLYVMNSDGDKGWYLYDIVEKTVQRYNSSDSTEEGSSYKDMYAQLNDKYNEDMESKMHLIYAFLVLTVILLFVIINLIIRLMDKKHVSYEHEEELDDVEEEDEYEDEYEEETDILEEDIQVEEPKQEKAKDKSKKDKKKKKDKKEKKEKKATVHNEEEEFENSEDDFDDSDDFELQIFDLDDK